VCRSAADVVFRAVAAADAADIASTAANAIDNLFI
jgi:hypothetical protein